MSYTQQYSRTRMISDVHCVYPVLTEIHYKWMLPAVWRSLVQMAINKRATAVVSYMCVGCMLTVINIPLGMATACSWCNQVLWSPQIVRKNTSDWRWDLQLEVRSPIGGEISDWRSHLWSEVSPPIGGTHVTCRNELFFCKKRLFIVDYIKPSPVYQVKCKLVNILSRWRQISVFTLRQHSTFRMWVIMNVTKIDLCIMHCVLNEQN